jgi:hypothetical protein
MSASCKIGLLSRRRAEFEHVYDGDLALLVAECARTTAAVDAILGRISPALATNAAAIADVTCQHELTRRHAPVGAHLRLLAGDRGRVIATRSGS